MKSFPEKTCSIENLVRNSRLVQLALEGKKTEQRRNGVYGLPGETFELENIRFVITDLKEQNLSEMTDADAQAEGYQDLNAYKDIILKMHPGMTWTNEGQVWVHVFKKV